MSQTKHRLARFGSQLLVAASLGCGTDEALPASAELLTGHEIDAWSAMPAPATVRVDLAQGEQRTKLAEGRAPASIFDIDPASIPRGTIAALGARAFDASGAVVLNGATVPFFINNIAGVRVPIFLARTGGWSRPPGTLERAHQHAAVAVAGHQYLIAAGGDTLASGNAAFPDFYDVANWTTLKGQAPLPRAPKSLVAVSLGLLVVDGEGATWLDLTTNKTNAAAPPDGLSFAEVTGGDTVALPSRVQFLIGGTRADGTPTNKVVRIDTDGHFRTVLLAAPRLGAAAAVVGGKLFVVGGSVGSEGAGAEVLNAGEDAFEPVALAADGSSGLAVEALEGSTAILVGGSDAAGAAMPVRTFDTSCATACATTTVGEMPIALRRTRAFAQKAGEVLVVGESADSETHAFSVTVTGGVATVAERALRERRIGATALLLPNGQVGVVGGLKTEGTDPVTTIEAFFP
ncbi:MAG TPA: hypothetical protein VJT73_06360 [Polyangiaceae bacterium]|nr:hypothetical protein [Polyangiaceae bacterium]